MKPVRTVHCTFLLPLLAFIFIGGAGSAGAMEITVSGGAPVRVISGDDLAGGAGSLLADGYVTEGGVLSLTGASGPSQTWRVDVRRTDLIWNAALSLSVIRTGDGLGGGLISGGETYMPVSTTDMGFFSGSGDRGAVEFDVRLTGMSVSVPPDTYSTTLYFTVVDTQ